MNLSFSDGMRHENRLRCVGAEDQTVAVQIKVLFEGEKIQNPLLDAYLPYRRDLIAISSAH